MFDLVIKNVNIVTERDTFLGAVATKGGKIAGLFNGIEVPEAGVTIDGDRHYLLPGGVDPHVHIRYPGGAHRETFLTGTQAAAAGGVTTIIEHPISEPPQYTVEILMNRVNLLKEQAIVDVAFLGAAGGEKIEHIQSLGRTGIVGYKTFLHAAPEGREKEFEGLTSKNNFELMEVLKEIAKTKLLAAAHGEDNDLVSNLIAKLRKDGKTYPIAHCESRPPIVEVLAIQRLITLANETGARLYLVHISTPEAVQIAKEARERGQEVYIETCPHYLYFTEDALTKYGAYAKCNPALRDERRVKQLWKFIEDGTIDTIGSDHAPYTVEEKERGQGDIFVAPSGMPSIEVRLPLTLTAVKRGRISMNRAVQLLSTNPARIFGLHPRKGNLCPGADADMVLVDLNEEYTINTTNMFTKSKDTAKIFEGLRVCGKVKKTFLRGELIFDDGKIIGKPGLGQWVRLKKEI